MFAATRMGLKITNPLDKGVKINPLQWDGLNERGEKINPWVWIKKVIQVHRTNISNICLLVLILKYFIPSLVARLAICITLRTKREWKGKNSSSFAVRNGLLLPVLKCFLDLAFSSSGLALSCHMYWNIV